MHSGLDIVTLGELRIALDGAPLARLASRKAEALLVYLACTGRPQQRDVLAELLWDELPSARGRGNLSVVLTSLRQALGPYLEVGRFGIALVAAGPLWLDCAELEQAARTALDASRGDVRLTPDEARRLDTAVALYNGDFLYGFSLRDGAGFEAWARAEQERLRALAVRARHALARNALETGSYDAGIEHALALVGLEPLDEDAHYVLLLLFGHAGRRGAALAHYEQFRRMLEAELGTAPAPRLSELYQQLWQGSFAPHAATAPSALPEPPTALIGRERELAELLALVKPAAGREPVRVLTLTGPGGVGKTRLALAVAAALRDEFADGAVFVDLAAVHDPALVATTLARTLDVAEQAGQEVPDTLVAQLRDQQRLLVIDNFEQVAAAAALLGSLAAACPRLVLIVTSRTPLRVQAEQQFEVLPLALPPGGRHARRADVVAWDAVQLFTARARAAQPRFAVTDANAATVAELCRKLDGLPLALELAAARVRTLPPASLLQQLARRFVILAGGGGDRPERHRALRATIAWSYELLSPEARQLFARLAVFAGGCTLEAIERVCRVGGSSDMFTTLAELIDQSLLQSTVDAEGTARLSMLETIRDYGQELLAAGQEAHALREEHAAYYLSLAEVAAVELLGPRQGVWLERLDVERGNLRAALDCACSRGMAEPALRLAAALWRFWVIRGHFEEGRRALAAALALGERVPSNLIPDAVGSSVDVVAVSGPVDSALVAAALNASAILALQQADYAAARTFSERSLALRRARGATADMAASLNNLGNTAYAQGDYTAAQAYHEESLALRRALNAKAGIAASLNNLGLVVEARADYAAAGALYRESLALQRELGDTMGIAYALHNLGSIAYMQGQYLLARTLLEESLALKRDSGDKWGIATSLCILGNVAIAEGSIATARARHEESLVLARDLGDRASIAQCLEGLAAVAAQTQPRRALRLAGAAAALRDAIGALLSPIEQDNVKGWLAPAHAALGADAGAAAWIEGRVLTLEAVTTYALDVTAYAGEQLHDRAS